MTRIRARGEQIRQYILDQVESHPSDIARRAAGKFRISRQAISKHLQKLTAEGALKESGRTRNRTYQLAPLAEWQKRFAITPALKDDLVWTSDIRPALGMLPDNVMNIWQTVFTEIFNNALEHSEGHWINVSLRRTAARIELKVLDDGIGIFAKIQAAFALPDEYHAVLELSKGKLTTDRRNHSGEGIFFCSRMVDFFVVASGAEYFLHQYGEATTSFREADHRDKPGTLVAMALSPRSTRTARQIYDEFTSGDDFGFNKTIVPVNLARAGGDALVSRSQAKRVLARVDQFKVVLLDFKDVEAIGQAFADEIFRVFPVQNPAVELRAINATPEVESMIARAKATAPV